MTITWGEIGTVVLAAIRPLPCLTEADVCFPSAEVGRSGVGPSVPELAERVDVALLMGVGALGVSVLIAVGAILVGVFLLRSQRDRFPPPTGAVVRRLPDEMQVLAPEAVPIDAGYQSPLAAHPVDASLTHLG